MGFELAGLKEWITQAFPVFSILLVACSLFVSDPAVASISFVKMKQNDQTANTNNIATGAFSATTGNFIVCRVAYNTTSGSLISVTDTASNSYSLATGPTTLPSSTWRQELWYAYNITGSGTLNITATLSATFNIWKQISCNEYSGVQATSDPKESVIGATGSSSLTSSAGPLTTSQGGSLLYGSLLLSGGTGEPGNSSIQRSAQNGDATEDRIANFSGSHYVRFSHSGLSDWVVQAAAFKAATPPVATNGLVQAATSYKSGATITLSNDFESANIAGNLIVVGGYFGGNGQTLTVSDTRGNTYQLAGTVDQTSDNHQIWIYYAENIAGGTNTVTGSIPASSTDAAFFIAEYSGIVTSGALDRTSGAMGSGSSISSGSTASTNSANELLVGMIGMSAGSSGFNMSFSFEEKAFVKQGPGNNNNIAALADQLVTATGTYAVTASPSGSEAWSAIIATFKRTSLNRVKHRVNNF